MEDQMKEILEFMRHENTEVRKKALEAVFAYSQVPEVITFIETSDMLKAIKACLFDLKLVHSALLVLLNISSNKKIVASMEENKIMDPLLQIIFNVMKTLNKEDIALKKHLLVEVGGTRIGEQGEIIREVQVNKGMKLSEDEVVTVLNIENLRLSLIIITNMCANSLNSKRQFLQMDSEEKIKGTNFIVLLGWFLVDEYELLFENFASLLNCLTEEDSLKEFLLSPTIRLETRIKRYLIHSNHLIRGSVLQCMRHLIFSHENEHLTERFCKFEPDEVHIIELNTRCLWMCLQQKYTIKEDHLKIIEKVLGTVWKPIKTHKKENPRIQTIDEEIEHCLDIFLVSTNFDFQKYFKEDELFDQEPVRQLKKVMALFADYAKEAFYRDKITAIVSVYTGEFII